MTTFEFLSHLRTLDVKVWAEGDRLRCNAPSTALTPELRAELSKRKTEILTFLGAAKTWAEPGSSLVPLQPAGGKRPFFGVPGHNGDVFCFVPLARHLGPDQPFYGLQPPGVDGQRVPLTQVEDLAAYFVKDIQAFQPEGPYLVGGYCLGGIIAFELAQQLRRQGQEVAALTLFGSPCPTSFRFFHRTLVAAQQFSQRVAQQMRMLWQSRPREWTGYLRDKVRQRKEERERDDASALSNPNRVRVEQATLSAVQRYEPRAYSGRINLFLASEQPANLFADRLLDWSTVAGNGLQIHTGPPDCNGDVMLREPHVKVFAKLLQSSLSPVSV